MESTYVRIPNTRNMYMQYELQATEMNMLRDTILAAE